MVKKSKSARHLKDVPTIENSAGTPLAGFRYAIQGRVQGVGFRDFAQREARKHRITGYTRNLADGSVLVCAVGTLQDLTNLEAALRQGPRWAEIRSFAMEEMETREFDDFRIVA